MIFNTNGCYAYCITETEEGCVINDGHGFVMEADQMIAIANKMIKYAKKHRKELEQHNLQRRKDFDAEMNAYKRETKQREKTKTTKNAFVYLLECGGRYKVGYSENVDRRIAQLDNRPFPITKIAISKQTPNAFDAEQYIHRKMEHCKIKGEWYELSNEDVERIKRFIENIL